MRGQHDVRQVEQARVEVRLVLVDVESVSDIQAGTRRDRTGHVAPVTLPPSDVLVYALEGGSRIIARPSGTEPKIKFYFDVREPMQASETPLAAEARAKGKMAALTDAFSHLAGV